MTTLPISDIVQIDTIISPVAPPTQERRTMFLTRDTSVLDAGGSAKVKQYGNFNELSADFASGTAPYAAAQRYFAQVPFPREFTVGRWAESAQVSQVRGGAPSAVADISGSTVNDYSFHVAGVDVTGIVVNSGDDYAAIAAAVQTAMRATANLPGGATSTCAYDATAGRFVLGFANDTELTAPASDAASGTALADLLGISAAEGGTFHVGSAAEEIGDALDAVKRLDDAAYFFVLEAAINDTADMVAASTWAQAQRVFLSIESQMAPGAAAAVAPQREALVAVEPRRTLMTNSARADYKSASAVARLSAVNYQAPNSVATLKFKTLPNTTPDDYTRSDVIALQGKNINFYVRYGGEPTYAEGQMMSGGWADEVAWIDWFTTAVEIDVFGLLRSMPKVPLTNVGLLQLHDVVEGPCRMGVDNGGLAPNQMSPEMTRVMRNVTGNQNLDGYLSTGYLIWIPPLSRLTQQQRDNRELPPFTIFGKGAGAVHGFAANFYFER